VDVGKLPNTAKEARDTGSTHYFTGKKCKNNHLAARRLSDNKCLECNKEMARRRRADPATKIIINRQRKVLRVNDGKSAYSRSLKQKREKYNEDPDFRLKIRKSQIERDYGISYEVFLRILEIQDSTCAICKAAISHEESQEKSAACIDHSHETGRVRGILCLSCNIALGRAQDDPEVLRSAVRYLRKKR